MGLQAAQPDGRTLLGEAGLLMMTVSGATSGFPAPCRAIICQIIAVRVRKGLTQTQVAERMRVSPARVSQLESGYRTPNLDSLVRYAKAVGAVISIGEAA